MIVYVIAAILLILTLFAVWRAIFHPQWGGDEIATKEFGGLDAHKWPWK